MEIDYIKCNGVSSCASKGICITVCALNAIMEVDGKPIIDNEKCVDCKLCVMNCPREAIMLNT